MSLRALREAANLTQEQLAERTGLHQTTISQLETGKNKDARYSTLEKLADAMNVSVEAVAAALTKNAEVA
jgi:transcriptional regulator with XRE-family HTH domain